MQYHGLKLDKFQEDSIKAIQKGISVVVSAPTGSGKTLIADYIINHEYGKKTRVIYTAPIKALSNQKYKEFTEEYGKEHIGLITGDVVINHEAPVLIMTTEIYRNMVIVRDPLIESISYVIFDEIHYINDIERGYVWEESILFSPSHVRFLCLSATIPNAEEFAEWIQSVKKHEVITVIHHERPVPLHLKFYDTELGITSLQEIKDVIDIPSHAYVTGKSRRRRPRVEKPDHRDLIKDMGGKLPCLFFNFSRMSCQKKAQELLRTKMFKSNPKISAYVRTKLAEAPPEVGQLKSTKLLRETLPVGIGFHHAGLLPVIKGIVEDLFSQGLIKVLYTTETFAMGINMPAKTVCFESMHKFDGVNFRMLNSKEFFQIAGRAGRRGIDKEGFVYPMIDRRDFDYRRIREITDDDIEPIKSQFKLSINTVLNLIDQHTQDEIDIILANSLYSFQTGKNQKKTFESIKKKLEKNEYLKKGLLTEKGRFASKIYSEEILTSELFATDFYKSLNEYQMLLLVACICYEPREKDEFGKEFPSQFTKVLKKEIRHHVLLKRDARFRHLDELTSLMHPCYHGKTLFDLMENTNILEGDLIRFLRQIIDRVRQIRHATPDEYLQKMMKSCQEVVENCLNDIDAI